MPLDPLARLEKLAAVANEGFATVQEVAESIVTVVHAIREYVAPLFERLSAAETKSQRDRSELDLRINGVESAATAEDQALARKIREIELTPGPKGDKGDSIKGDPGEPGPSGSPDTAEQVRDKLASLKPGERLHVNELDGIEELKGTVEVRQGRGLFGIPSRGFYLYVGGVKKGIMSNLNLVAGTGMAIAYSQVNKQDTITFNSTGGGITVATPPESANASNTQFTVASQPKWMVADGTTYYENNGYTYSAGAGKVTFTIAPSEFVRAIL